MNSQNIYAKDVVISFANNLPSKLVLDLSTRNGQLTVNLLLQLTKKMLSQLAEEAKKIPEEEAFFLEIFEIPKKYLGKKCPTEVRAATVDLSTVDQVLFNGSTCPVVRKYNQPSHYVSVTLVLRE